MISPRCIGIAALGLLFFLGEREALQGAIGPRVSVSPDHVELGRIERGSAFSFKLSLNNVGDEDLVIQAVETTCGCLSPTKKWKDVSLRSGEGRILEFEMIGEASGQGRAQKAIWIKTNDPMNPVSPVPVTYVVKPQYKLSAHPNKLLFGNLDPNATATIEMKIVSPFPEDLKVMSVSSSGLQLGVAPSGSSRLGDVLSYSVSVPSGTPPGGFAGSLCFATSAGGIVIPFEGYRVGSLECSPRRIMFPPAKAGQAVAVPLIMRSPAAKAFRIILAKSQDGRILIQDDDEVASVHKVEARFTADEGMHGTGDAYLEVVTDILGTTRVDCSYMVLE